MGPEYGTPEYQRQVDAIVKFITNSELRTREEIDKALVLFVLDESFSRSAIAEAGNKVAELVED